MKTLFRRAKKITFFFGTAFNSKLKAHTSGKCWKALSIIKPPHLRYSTSFYKKAVLEGKRKSHLNIYWKLIKLFADVLIIELSTLLTRQLWYRSCRTRLVASLFSSILERSHTLSTLLIDLLKSKWSILIAYKILKRPFLKKALKIIFKNSSFQYISVKHLQLFTNCISAESWKIQEWLKETV